MDGGGYKMRTIVVDDDTGETARVKVSEHLGVEGYWTTYTDVCSGCFEAGDYMGQAHHYRHDDKAGCYVGHGCDECGYTGKRRHTVFCPFDLDEFARAVNKMNQAGEDVFCHDPQPRRGPSRRQMHRARR